MCHALQKVVDNDGKVVGDQPITSMHHEISGFSREPLCLGTLKCIDETDRVGRSSDPDSGFATVSAIPAGARVDCAQWTSWRVRQVTP